MNTINLFPLKIVLFPEAVIPLHIFEERYKKLINYSFSNKNSFGINLKSGVIVEKVGCITEVSDIVKNFDDGRLDILVKGIGRFKINEYSLGDEGYFIAKYHEYRDLEDSANPELLKSCSEIFNQIADSIKTVTIDKLYPNKIDLNFPSYYIGQKAGLTLIQRQLLLEMRSETQRLTYLLDHLQKTLPMVKEAEFVSQLIKNDGYYSLPKFNNFEDLK